GEPPHIGNTVQSIIAKVLTDKPQSVRLLRETIPEHVDIAIQRALAKLPADRWASAHEFADALHGKAVSVRSAIARRDSSLRRRLTDPIVLGLAFITLMAIAGAVWMARGRPSDNNTLPARFALTLPPNIQLDNVYSPLTITPNGRYVIIRASTPGGIQL